MRFSIIVVTLLTLFIFSCKTQEKSNVSKSSEHKEKQVRSKELLIRVEATPCFGSCPAYTMSIFKNGRVTYNGQKFVKTTGAHTGAINGKEIDLITEKIKEIGYFNLEDEYDQPVTDLPTVTTTVILDGKKKTIKARIGHPDSLKELHKLLHGFTESIEWNDAE